MISSNRVIIISLIFLIVNVNVFAEQTVSDQRTTSTGSIYKYLLDIPSVFEEGAEYKVQVILSAISFGDGISDFHDILLYVQAKSDDTLVFEGKMESLLSGEISKAGSNFFKSWTFEPHSAYPDWINIYVSSTFREDKSFASDPETNDGWVYMTTINKKKDSSNGFLNFPLELSLLVLIPLLFIRKRSISRRSP